MGQALKFCTTCENKRGCDLCTDLHNWIMEHLDAEKVVRCRDCKKFREPFCMLNDAQSGYLTVVHPEHYCGYGERKDGGGNGLR